jgi:hypothetical protein
MTDEESCVLYVYNFVRRVAVDVLTNLIDYTSFRMLKCTDMWSVQIFFHSIKMKRKLYLYKMKSSEMFLEELVFSKTRFYYSLKLASLQNSCRQLNLLGREEVRLLKSGQIGLRDALNNAINCAPS